MEPNTQPTQSGKRVSQGLDGVRQKAKENKQERFTALLHHVTPKLLEESYYAIKRKAGWQSDSTICMANAWPGPPRSLPGATVAENLHSEGQREAKTVGNRGAGGQDRSARRGNSPQCSL